MIKPADKDGAVVVWQQDLYEQEALNQLGDDRFYKPIDTDATDKHKKEVNQRKPMTR